MKVVETNWAMRPMVPCTRSTIAVGLIRSVMTSVVMYGLTSKLGLRSSTDSITAATRSPNRSWYRWILFWRSVTDWLATRISRPTTETKMSTVIKVANPAGTRWRTSQSMIGRLRTARNSARAVGSRIGAANFSP